MKKVLMLSDHRISLDRRIIAEANSLAQNGFNVTLVSTPIPDDYSDLLDPRIDVKIHPKNKKEIVKNVFYKHLLGYLGNSQSPFIENLKFLKRKQLLNSATEYLVSHTPQKSYDIIHTHDLNTLPAALKLKEMDGKSVSLIYDAHEMYAEQYTLKKEMNFWRQLEETCLNKVDAMITVNPSCAAYFKETYTNCPSVEIIYNSYLPREIKAPDLTKEAFCNQMQFEQNLPIFVFQGVLSPERNLPHLVSAFKDLKKTANLLVIGDGPVLTLLKRIKKQEALNNVSFVGWVPQQRLSYFLAFADAGIIPYLHSGKLNYLYCTPNKLFEYMAFKIPMCVNRLPELIRIINTYNIGKSYQLDTPEKIKDAILDFVAHLNDFSEASFIKANEALGWPNQEATLLKLYESVQSENG